MQYFLSDIKMKNYLIASSSPLTESVERIKCCYEAGFAAAILKSAADYERTGTGYGRKVIYTNDGYYADSSFEHEILTIDEGLNLYRKSLAICPDMLLIPSISASSLNASDWITPCQKFENLGAKLLQLDFFYLGSLEHDTKFYNSLQLLLETLTKTLKCKIMPKLNPRFEPNTICQILKISGIHTISLLDSIRETPNDYLELHKETTSYFGSRQFPYTLNYLKIAKQYGLEVCAGGGITSKEDVDILLAAGANMIQVASYILNRNFESTKDLLGTNFPTNSNYKLLRHNPWCDTENGALCQDCGACIPHALVKNNSNHLH